MADPRRAGDDDGADSTQVVHTAWFFYLLLGLGGIVWVGLREEVIPLSLFFDPAGWWIDLGVGAAAGLVLLAVWSLGLRFLAAGRELESRLGELLGGLSTDEAVALALLSGVAEELFFRGAVQGSWGWAWATVLFGLLHSGPGRIFGLWTVFALLAGALFGGLMEWRGNLLAPVVAHVLVNAVNLRRVGAAGGSAQAPGADDGSGPIPAREADQRPQQEDGGGDGGGDGAAGGDDSRQRE